jgi:hypothetical protein
MIYFIRDEATQHIKIGFTAGDAADRLRDLQTGCPGQLVLLLQIEGSKQDETAWHDRFADSRVRDPGEWFKPLPELMLAIMEAKVLHLEGQNAQLQARLDAERERVHEARSTLGQVWALMDSEPLPMDEEPLPLGLGVLRPAKATPLEAENARLQAKLEAERGSRESFRAAIYTVCGMLEGPAVLPEGRQAGS